MRFGNGFRIRSNSDLYGLFNNIDIVQRINSLQLSWLEHINGIKEDVPASPVFDAGICVGRDWAGAQGAKASGKIFYG